MGRVLPDPASPREKIRALMLQKDSIEAEISTHISTLKANANSSMTSPLVDAEGFPRADIDIYAVRGARVRIIELRNDLKAVMAAISSGLETVYAPSDATIDSLGEATTQPTALKPFAKVNAIAPGSPAATAGLQKDDLIVKFGHLTQEQCATSLQPIAALVAENEDNDVAIRVLRGADSPAPVFLNLVPKKGWGGRGLLGCHIVPT